jgi:hypothetical protein
MKTSMAQRPLVKSLLLALGLGGLLGLTGCQVDVGGQTLPSAYYMSDDVQYFPPGHEFKLYREAATQKEFAQQQQAAQR